jgi:hypothetical protein
MSNELISSLLVSIFGTGFANWVLRTWISERIKNSIKNEYEQKLETHKASLKSQSDVEIEKLRTNLSLVALEHQVKFSKLHEVRASVIAETYEKLKDLHFKLCEYVEIFEPIGGKPRSERREHAVAAHQVFRQYFQAKLIFFPQQTAGKIESINQELVRVFNNFSFEVDMAPQTGGNPAEKWILIFHKLNGEIGKALEEIEAEFRNLLGDK